MSRNTNTYEISIKNCRNIKSISPNSICISKNSLNVFYGNNGTGKSTLVQALSYIYEPTDENKKKLESFEYRSNHDPRSAPNTECGGKIKHLLVFNDEWINAHCFTKSGIHENAFKLYVLNGEVRKFEKQRQQELGRLRKTLMCGETETLEKTLSLLSKNVAKTKKDGTLTEASTIKKAYKDGVPTEPVPKTLKPILLGMSTEEKAEWLKWHLSRPEIHDESICPYCGTYDLKRQKICREYDGSRSGDDIKYWLTVASTYNEFKNCLSVHYSSTLRRIVNSSTPPDGSLLSDIARLCETAKTTADSISEIKGLLIAPESADATMLVNKLEDESRVLARCDLFRKTSHGEMTDEHKALQQIIDAIKKIVIAQAELKSISNDLNSQIADSISGHEEEIDGFLAQCGYPYEIKIECNVQTSEAQILLKPTESDLIIDDSSEALSYGERNALALMLFMHEAINEKDAFLILDDPISSFDYDKRFGILYALFSSSSECRVFEKNLSGRTVLVMTHDPLVVKDLIAVGSRGFKKKTIEGQYLSCDKYGTLSAVPLDDSSMVPFTQLLLSDIRKCQSRARIFGYVKIRQLSELLRRGKEDSRTKYGCTFSLLSDIVHGRNIDETLEKHHWSDKNHREVRVCENLIKELMGWKIDYWVEINFYSDCMPYLIGLYDTLGLSTEDKLLLVRLMIERDGSLSSGAEVLKRFTDESCHIGGSYLFQFDDSKFDRVPFYVVDWCEKVVDDARIKYVPSTVISSDNGI